MTAQFQSTQEETQVKRSVQQNCQRPMFMPQTDIYETESAFTLLLDLPGVDETAIEITVEKNILSIQAKVETQEPAGHSLTYFEYSTGDYERRFVMPNEIDRDNIQASMKNGVLQMILPKSKQSSLKKIAVNAQ